MQRWFNRWRNKNAYDSNLRTYLAKWWSSTKQKIKFEFVPFVSLGIGSQMNNSQTKTFVQKEIGTKE